MLLYINIFIFDLIIFALVSMYSSLSLLQSLLIGLCGTLVFVILLNIPGVRKLTLGLMGAMDGISVGLLVISILNSTIFKYAATSAFKIPMLYIVIMPVLIVAFTRILISNAKEDVDFNGTGLGLGKEAKELRRIKKSNKERLKWEKETYGKMKW